MNTRRTNLWTCRRDHARCRTGSLRLGVDRLPDTVGLGMAMLAAACRPPAPDGPGTQWALAASTHPESKGRKGKVRWPRCRGGAHRRAAPRRHSHTRTRTHTPSHARTWTQGFPARRTGHTALTGLLEEADEHGGHSHLHALQGSAAFGTTWVTFTATPSPGPLREEELETPHKPDMRALNQGTPRSNTGSVLTCCMVLCFFFFFLMTLLFRAVLGL